jgi:hypothetical protein
MATTPIGTLSDAQRLISSKGVTQATEAVPVDTSVAISYFMGAAQQQEYYSVTGLSQYKDAMAQAKAEVVSGYQSAIAELRPEQASSRAALNEMMRFSGIDPVQASVGITDKLSGIPGVNGSGLNNLITQAQNERDPAKRAQLQAQVNAAFDATSQQVLTSAQAKANQQASLLPTIPTAISAGAAPNKKDYMTNESVGWEKSKPYAEAMASYDKALATYNANQATMQANYQKQVDAQAKQKATMLSEATTQGTEYQNQLKELQSQFNTGYTPEYDKAYTGQQVIDKLEATPGFQFQMDAGSKAIERQGAAKGMLGSGNTLLSLQQYGQDLAQGYFQQHMSNLQAIAQKGSGASTSIADLYSKQGTLLGTLSQATGTRASDVYNMIGQGYSAAFNNAATTSFQAAVQESQQKFAGQESAKSRAQSIASGIIANAPALAAANASERAAAGVAAAMTSPSTANTNGSLWDARNAEWMSNQTLKGMGGGSSTQPAVGPGDAEPSSWISLKNENSSGGDNSGGNSSGGNSSGNSGGGSV